MSLFRNMQLDIPSTKICPSSFVRNPACGGGSSKIGFFGIVDNYIICSMVEVFNKI